MRRVFVALLGAALLAVVAAGGGTAAAPTGGLTVSPTKYNFGRTIVGYSHQATFTVTNGTNAPIYYSDWTGSTGFVAGSNTGCATVAVGSTCTFNAVFSPTETGHYRGTVSLVWTTGPSQTTVRVTVNLSGSAYQPKGTF